MTIALPFGNWLVRFHSSQVVLARPLQRSPLSSMGSLGGNMALLPLVAVFPLVSMAVFLGSMCCVQPSCFERGCPLLACGNKMVFSPAAVALEPWPRSWGVHRYVGACPGPQSQCAATYPGHGGTVGSAFISRVVPTPATRPWSPAPLSALFVPAFSVKRVTSVSFYVCICHQASCFQGPSILERIGQSPCCFLWSPQGYLVARLSPE